MTVLTTSARAGADLTATVTERLRSVGVPVLDGAAVQAHKQLEQRHQRWLLWRPVAIALGVLAAEALFVLALRNRVADLAVIVTLAWTALLITELATITAIGFTIRALLTRLVWDSSPATSAETLPEFAADWLAAIHWVLGYEGVTIKVEKLKQRRLLAIDRILDPLMWMEIQDDPRRYYVGDAWTVDGRQLNLPAEPA